MNKEQEIEEMARTMCVHFEPCMQGQPCTACKTYTKDCYTIYKARRLSKAGYGNIEKAIQKFAERLIDEFQSYSQLGIKQSCELIKHRAEEYSNEQIR